MVRELFIEARRLSGLQLHALPHTQDMHQSCQRGQEIIGDDKLIVMCVPLAALGGGAAPRGHTKGPTLRPTATHEQAKTELKLGGGVDGGGKGRLSGGMVMLGTASWKALNSSERLEGGRIRIYTSTTKPRQGQDARDGAREHGGTSLGCIGSSSPRLTSTRVRSMPSSKRVSGSRPLSSSTYS
jgi:hypothetical protein